MSMKQCALEVSYLAGMLLAVAVPLMLDPPASAADKAPATGGDIVLTTITQREDDGAEAELYDRFNNKKLRLRLAEGADTFQFTDKVGKETATVRASRLDRRELVFRTGNKYYAVHIGQTIADALRAPLDPDRVKELKLLPPNDLAGEVRDLKDEIKSINRRLREIEKRLDELEKPRQE
jgi:hypothetical protein